MALDETTKTAVLTRKKLIIESIVTALMVIILVVLVSINKKGVDILKPEYVLILILLTMVSTGVTLYSYFKLKNDKITNITYQVSDLFSMITLAVAIIQIVFAFIIFPAQVVQTSMYPTFHDEQLVLCKSNVSDLERFDIVVVLIDKELEEKSNGVLDEGELIVKRVIGLPGEEIRYIDNRLYVNGTEVSEEFLSDDVETGNVATITLGENEYLILGDHRSSSKIDGSIKPGSYDGRDFGSVNLDDIIGIVKYKMNGIFDWEKVK